MYLLLARFLRRLGLKGGLLVDFVVVVQHDGVALKVLAQSA